MTKADWYRLAVYVLWGLGGVSLGFWMNWTKGVSWPWLVAFMVLMAATGMVGVLHESAVIEEAGPGWRPIESAPRDGTTILVYSRDEDEISMVEWYRGARTAKARWYVVYAYDGDSGDNVFVQNPTHWMPLPEAPK